MDLDLSDEQLLLRDTIRQLCEENFPLTALRRTENNPDRHDGAFWQQLCEMGVPGICVPEKFGGLGLGMLEASVLFECLGSCLSHTPLFASSVLAVNLLQQAGTAEQIDRWLPRLASAETLMTVASYEPGTGFGLRDCETSFSVEGDSITITGEKIFVPFASLSSALIVFGKVAGTDTIAAAIVPRETAGVMISLQENLGSEAYFSVRLHNAVVPVANLLIEGQVEQAWRETMFRGLILLAAQAAGAARRIHDISLNYAREREAFGQPIGGFQAIAHYLADAIVEIEGCQTLFFQAAWFHDNGRPFALAAAIAKLQCCSMFRKVSSLGIQVHGGFGYTTEADPQLFFRRAKQWQLLNWDDTYLEDQIAFLAIDAVTEDA